MELRRTLLIVGMAIAGYFLMINWQKDYGAVAVVTQAADKASASEAVADIPAAPAKTAATPANGDIPVAPQKTDAPVLGTVASNTALISVQTDVLNLQIDPVGGDIVRVALPAYTETIDSKNPFVLLDHSAQRTFIAQSGLIGTNGPDANPQGRPHYQASATSFALASDARTLQVVLNLTAENNVQIKKIYEFTRGDYLVKLRYEVTNNGTAPWNGLIFGQLKRDTSKDPSASSQGFGMSTFLGAAWWTPQKSYNKRVFKDFEEKPVNETATGGWAAIVQHYFVTAWVPDAKSSNTIKTRVKKEAGEYLIGYTGPEVSVAPGSTKTFSAALYTGPKIQKNLEVISDGLELTVDFGWLWFIAQGLFWLLTFLHGIVGNWGWAIILLTTLVKAILFYPSAISYKSMAHMRRVTPEMQRIKELHGSDRAKQSQAMMELYKREKINPLGGCLPILLQMPIFMALYWTLMESVELRHAPWILWIRDLSVMDQYFVLPLIMGVSMFVQQQLNPAPPDPMQARVMKLMPIVFTFMFLWFPAGLVLYWVVNNVLSIAQQWVITKQIERAAATKKA
jgi:YidC/Oxa1 family membrane protein insertase